MNAKFLAAAIAMSAAASAPALAADLPSIKGPPAFVPPPPLLSWTGFYGGVNAGGAWSDSNSTTFGAAGFIDDPLWLPAAPFAASASGVLGGSQSGGFLGGGQIGYNYQFGSFVLGVETDFQGVAGGGASAQGVGAVFNPLTGSNAITTTSVSRRLDRIGTVRGRAGWLATPTILLYGTGGFAYAGGSFNVQQASFDDAGFYGPGFGSFTSNGVATGWTAGGGLEWMFMPNWSAKVEYLRYDLGSRTATLAVAGADFTAPGNGTGIGFINAVRFQSRVNGNIVRAGVNYHFNWGSAPIVAGY
jgi:outer membrane immunogenic protein